MLCFAPDQKLTSRVSEFVEANARVTLPSALEMFQVVETKVWFVSSQESLLSYLVESACQHVNT